MDPDPLLWQILLQLFLIALNAVFACAEIAVISINEQKLAKSATNGDKRATRLLKLSKNPAKFLSVIQVCITLAGFLGSAFAADNFSDRLVDLLIGAGVKIPLATLDTIAVIVITLVLSYFTLVLGELVPKRIAMRHSEKIALGFSRMLTIVSKIVAPIVWLLTVSTNGLLRLFGIDPNAKDDEVTEEEIRLMVDAGSEGGAIDSEERQFIHNLFDLDNKKVMQLMTHRTAVAYLKLEETPEQWNETINKSTHTIYPVCDKNIDNVVGILNTKDYFRLKEKNREAALKIIKPAYCVLDNIYADVLFKNMKKSKNHFAVVLDEYGGTHGIVTLNDLLEHLVGDLDDEEVLVNGKDSLIKKFPNRH